MKTILIIDDEENIRKSLVGILQDEGFTPVVAGNGEEGLEKMREEAPDLIMLDIWMPGMDGIETLQKIKAEAPDQIVVMMSGHGTIETAVKATKHGAFDFIEKPLSLEKVLHSIQQASVMSALVEENRALKETIAKEHEMIGASQPISELKQQIDLAAPTSGWVLITGENGTGKELVARSVHLNSQRKAKPFIEVNCAAIPEELIESELFGHEKGAFTGATAQRKGKFDKANGGTLFLDEIGDMSLKTQAKILRILQEHKFERVGGNQTIEVDVRVIAATNKDLEEEIKQGNFREDLYYRLNVLPFHVPPLRERSNDVQALAMHFLEFFCTKEGKTTKKLSDDSLNLLTQYSWPGNVRELKNIIERLAIMTVDEIIEPNHLPTVIIKNQNGNDDLYSNLASQDDNFRQARDQFEKAFITQKLQENNWNVSKTAEQIEIERSNLHRKIKTYGIDLKK